jgi:hypothetical protein
MTRKILLPTLLLLALWLSACGENSAPALTAQAADPCSAQNLPESVKKIHNLTREFDKYSTLASNTPQTQIVQVLPDMQRIETWMEDQAAPPCLQHLKDLQIQHVKTVNATLMIFMNAADQTALDQVNAGIAYARDLHLQYDVERARVLGITLTPAPPTLTPAP